jgi:hypothetical protein
MHQLLVKLQLRVMISTSAVYLWNQEQEEERGDSSPLGITENVYSPLN